jgi:ABC-type lipoprotein release transport system permease subunit
MREIEQVVPVRFGQARAVDRRGAEVPFYLTGVGGPARGVWSVVRGRDLPWSEEPGPPAILINQLLAQRLDLAPGDSLLLNGACETAPPALPAARFHVAGIMEQRFEVREDSVAITTLDALARVCEAPDRDAVTFYLVASRPATASEDTVAAIRDALPDLHAFTNQEFVSHMEATDFSYFRQVAFVLSTITMFFAALLTATLLTVSVNQRLGEIAALRALGFLRRSVVAALLWESFLIVGSGALLGLPLGGLLALRLDAILREMPGIPMRLHFFVFRPEAALVYGLLLVSTAVVAAAYPVYLAARLPIATTLRREVVS